MTRMLHPQGTPASRLIFKAKRQPVIEEFSLSPLGENDVLLRTEFSVISPGTERAFLLAEPNTDPHEVGFPFAPGYSNVGRVIEIGSSVKHIQPGDMIATMTPHQSHSIVCVPELNGQHLGNVFDKMPHSQLGWKLPSSTTTENELSQIAAFMIATVSLYGIRIAKIDFGDHVTIVGLGPIGLIAGQLAMRAGATSVTGVAGDARLREAATQSGFDHVHKTMPTDYNPQSNFGCHIVIECTGRVESLIDTIEKCPQGATLVLLGCTRGALPDVNFYNLIQRKAITIIGAHQPTRTEPNYLERRVSLYRDARIVIEMIANGKLDIGPALGITSDIDQFQTVYESICNRELTGAVVFKWNEH
ncbi:zinc-dependent alcohol dehydrogenase [Methylobacter luteus]|uniref:zinc-dependent alcohol dehydrogenase n=1 Tax=Methylobacter luteus TaxID=415 RepID=UPI00041AAF88|nr:zinc-binding alcohol dehydrogenase [Methylobacter luteus]